MLSPGVDPENFGGEMQFGIKLNFNYIRPAGWRNGQIHCYRRRSPGFNFRASQMCQFRGQATVANGSPPLQRFCVAQALRHGDGSSITRFCVKPHV